MPKIIQYRKKCIGCGICHELQPAFWAMSKKDGKAVLLNAASKKDIHTLQIPGEAVDQSMLIAKACPVNIIKITHEKSDFQLL